MRSETLVTPLSNTIVSIPRRVKVYIRCRKCGEAFILRGTKNLKGHIETGFKRCICSNEHDFDIESIL